MQLREIILFLHDSRETPETAVSLLHQKRLGSGSEPTKDKATHSVAGQGRATGLVDSFIQITYFIGSTHTLSLASGMSRATELWVTTLVTLRAALIGGGAIWWAVAETNSLGTGRYCNSPPPQGASHGSHMSEPQSSHVSKP